MRRRLLHLLTAFSLLLCVVVSVLWVRSYQAHDVLSWDRADNSGGQHHRWYRVVASGRGRIALSWDAEVAAVADITPEEAARPTGRWQWGGWHRESPRYPSPGFGGTPNLRWGFHFRWNRRPGTVRREVILPYWALALPALAFPACRLLIRSRRSERRRRGVCLTCGYDLRATPDRCPECGTIPATVDAS